MFILWVWCWLRATSFALPLPSQMSKSKGAKIPEPTKSFSFGANGANNQAEERAMRKDRRVSLPRVLSVGRRLVGGLGTHIRLRLLALLPRRPRVIRPRLAGRRRTRRALLRLLRLRPSPRLSPRTR